MCFCLFWTSPDMLNLYLYFGILRILLVTMFGNVVLPLLEDFSSCLFTMLTFWRSNFYPKLSHSILYNIDNTFNTIKYYFFILYNKDNLGASSEGIPDASGILHLNEAFYKKLSGVMFYVKFNEN